VNRVELVPVAPFMFVAAVRYGINRTTGISEKIAIQVEQHADLIRADAGCCSAILREIKDWRASKWDQERGLSRSGMQRIDRAWARAEEALRETT
jgi:hypothetical protein